MPQFNTFRILFSLSSVFHFECFGYPYIIIIIIIIIVAVVVVVIIITTTKISVRGYSKLGDTQN